MHIFWAVIGLSSFTLPLLVQCTWGYNQGFSVEPHNVSSLIGESVIIPCKIFQKKGKVYWSKHEQIIAIERQTFGIKRYSIIGSDSDGNYSLKIDPVGILDDGEYRCSVTSVKFTDSDLRSKKVWLSVWLPPMPPVIMDADFFYAIENTLTQLDCVSKSGNPPAYISWLDNKNRTVTENIAYSSTPDSYGITYTSISSLTFVPNYLDNNTNYTCRAQNSAEKTYQSTTIELNILYKPKVQIEIMSFVDSQGLIPLGSDVVLFCRVQANPSRIWYTWYLDSIKVAENGTSELVINNIEENHDRTIVRCSVNNSLGNSSNFIELRVRYGPKLHYIPKKIEEKKGANVSLKCDVTGNPTPSFLWTHKSTQQVVGNESNLFIILNENTMGMYECSATILGKEPVKGEVEVILLYPPDIVKSQALQDDKGNAWLECVASSLSAANKPFSNITWIYNGNAINPFDQKFHIEETKFLNHSLKSILFIQNVENENYGTYLCTASNSNGLTSVEIILQSQSTENNDNLATLIGIGLLLIVTIISMYFFVQKKLKKNLVYEINDPNAKNSTYVKNCENNLNFLEDSVLSDAVDGISFKNSNYINYNPSSFSKITESISQNNLA